MKPQHIIIATILLGVLLIVVVILATSPMTPQLMHSGSPATFIDAVLSLTLVVLLLAAGCTLCITLIIACCYLAKRLGYEMISGLLLLLPVVNIIVFLSWAFRESPNERKLRMALKKGI